MRGGEVSISADTTYAKYLCMNGTAAGEVPVAGTCTDGSSPQFVPDDFSRCRGDATLGVGYGDALGGFAYGTHCYKPDGSTDFDFLGSGDQYESQPSWMSFEWWTSGAFLIYIAGILLGYAGWILNSSIYYFILTAADLLRGTNGPGIGTSIVEGWTIIRDIINLTFVFGLIYVAFMTVVKADTHDLKHAVPKILMFAILINFSLYFTKIIVDVSNVTSIEIHKAMSVQLGTGQSSDALQNNAIDDGISGYFMQRLGLLNLFYAEDVIGKELAQT
jgi:hypothetical protein